MQAGRNIGWGVVGFTIPLEGNGSAVVPSPIKVVLVAFPEIVRDVDGDHDVLVHPQMITCGSRLLLIACKRMPMPVDLRRRVRGGRVKKEVVIILWELRNNEWVEITRMPLLVCME